ncbi:MAG TPA: cytochrome c oxidase subunit 3 [Candidatus Sulfomarinibacteraceae bacterium]|nr:cytochrome c oxidase subunit 3 [Candidatus Sulfomarinibacteraceae bacterium]
MSATTAGSHDFHEEHELELPYSQRLRNNRLGLWLFCFSELFLFGGLLMARFYLWRDPATGAMVRPELDQALGLATTSVLLVSSLFMALGETAMANGDRKRFSRYFLLTAFLGTLFLIGVVGLEWGGHIRPTDGAFGAIFYGMTGLHALHVLSGVILILIVWWNGRKGAYTAEDHWGVEATAIYWHYVDVVWVFFYPALYLIGQAVHL